jgi:hypothetical protein
VERVIQGTCILVERVIEGTCILGNVQQTCSLVNVYFRKHVCYGACSSWNVYLSGTCIGVVRVFEWNVYLSGTCI